MVAARLKSIYALAELQQRGRDERCCVIDGPRGLEGFVVSSSASFSARGSCIGVTVTVCV